MPWEQLWAWYKQASEEIQQEILEQIQIESFIRELAPKYQIEVLQSAPMLVVQSIKYLLSTRTQKRLGLDTASTVPTPEQSRNELLRIMLK